MMEIDGVNVLTGALFAGGTRSWCTKADGRVTCMPNSQAVRTCIFAFLFALNMVEEQETIGSP